MKYEINPVYFGPAHENETMFSMLTGLDFKTLNDRFQGIRYWPGQLYVRLFREFGFNTNPRFVRFDPDTPYPCVLRCRTFDRRNPYWYAFVYYDGVVYTLQGTSGSFAKCSRTIHRKRILLNEYYITSMLQVWI